MSIGWAIVSGLFVLSAALVFVAGRGGFIRGRQEAEALAAEEKAKGFEQSVKAVLNEKMATDELAARERLLARRTRKP